MNLFSLQSYPVCQGAPPAPEPSRLYEAPDHKRSQNHHTLSDRETGSLAPGGHIFKQCFFRCFDASFHTSLNKRLCQVIHVNSNTDLIYW